MPLQLQSRDIDILKFIFSQRVATQDQISRKFFSGKSRFTPSKRLIKLQDGGYLNVEFASHNNKSRKYFLATEKVYDLIRESWPFEIDNPHYKSKSVDHDIHVTELCMRLEKLQCFGRVYPENLLQSSSSHDYRNGLYMLRLLNTDAALVLINLEKEEHTFAVEMEVSCKESSRYQEKLRSYYQVSSISGLIYVCSDQKILNALTKADEIVRENRKSILYLALESDVLSSQDGLTFRTPQGKALELA